GESVLKGWRERCGQRAGPRPAGRGQGTSPPTQLPPPLSASVPHRVRHLRRAHAPGTGVPHLHRRPPLGRIAVPEGAHPVGHDGRMGTEGASGNGNARHNARVIAGRYRLEERLGRGGMGVVWRATDQLLGRGVAVKELPVDETLSAAEARKQRERTLREARALAQLSHPHITVVHDVVEDDERPYIVPELIDGPSLAERIARDGPVDADEAARIGIDLLCALRAAHAAGVLHRDLKPANVLLENGTDRVVLTDFGIARVAGATTLTEHGSFVGSPEYTAPERMAGARTGPESDLWSLGALLCTALSGES